MKTVDYPFTIHSFECQTGQLAYLDEGSGQPLVIVCCNSEWRNTCYEVVLALRKHCRCLMAEPFSVCLDDEHYPKKLAAYAQHIEEWLESLDVQEVLLVAFQSGVLCISYAIHHPEKVKEVIIFNIGSIPEKGGLHLKKIAATISKFVNCKTPAGHTPVIAKRPLQNRILFVALKPKNGREPVNQLN